MTTCKSCGCSLEEHSPGFCWCCNKECDSGNTNIKVIELGEIK